VLKFQIGSQLWKTQILRWILIGLGKLSERVPTFSPRKSRLLRIDEGCSKLSGQRKKAKMQWFQGSSDINMDTLNNIRRETSRHFMNKKREYLKDKIDELAANCKNKNNGDLYTGINYFRVYQLRSNLVKDENGDLLAQYCE
jgi:hypothetical protein